MSTFDPKIRVTTPRRNRFPLSYYTRLTSRMGDLVPVLCKKIVPGDRFKVSMSSITRLAPMANPVYDRVRIDYDAFFVQNRIIDPDWKGFITGGNGLYGESSTEGMKDIHFVGSAFSSSVKELFGAGSLVDYLGLQFNDYGTDGTPTAFSGQSFNFSFNANPVLGYYKIFEDWYRNERFDVATYTELLDSSYYNDESRTINGFGSTITPVVGDGKPIFEIGQLMRRRYGKDYYTTALAEPVVGGPVNVPSLSGLADVKLNYVSGGNGTNPDLNFSNTSSLSLTPGSGAPSGSGNIVADLSTAITSTIQQLNEAYKFFKFFMKDTYNGNRYVEFIESHFGVRVPDATLERPIFLGRNTQWLNFSEIFQTSGATSEDNVLGDYAGMGVTTGSGFLFDQEFNEHGLIYVIMSIRPNSTYFQGVNQEFFFGDRFTYFFPEFQNIGDEVIPVQQLYFDPSSVVLRDLDLSEVDSENTFGFNRRWGNYLWYKDEMHGYFLLENQMYNWSFARKFSDRPVLGSDFVEVQPVNNPFTYRDTDNQNYYTDIFFKISALRPFERYENF